MMGKRTCKKLLIFAFVMLLSLGCFLIKDFKVHAATTDNSTMYIFSGETYIKYDFNSDTTYAGYPASVFHNWQGLPWTSFDTAVAWPNGKIYFFKGSQYIRYDIATDKADTGILPINGNWPGLTFSSIDAAIVWPNGKAYFFKDNQYIKYDIATDKAEASALPINGNWPGVTFSKIDAAVAAPNGKTYFFKDNQYIKYDIATDKAETSPIPIEGNWKFPSSYKTKITSAITCSINNNENITNKNQLKIGEKLKVGEKLVSSNGQYSLELQKDGNLGVYRVVDHYALFSALTKSGPISNDYYAILQPDGNFAVKDGNNNPVWYNSTQNKNGVDNVVKLMDDGSLGVLSGDEVIWKTDSAPKDTLKCGETLHVGENLTSLNGKYILKVQTDGNLGVFRTSDNKPIYSALKKGEAISNSYYAILQTDGNFAVKDENNNAVWYNGTQNKNGKQNVVKLLNDGSLAVINGTRCIWNTDPEPRNTLTCGETLYLGQKLTSPNGQYTLVLQKDGNLGVYRTCDNYSVFSALTKSQTISDGYYAVLQPDGNFAVKDENNMPVWYNSTQNKDENKNVVKLLDNGSLAVYSGSECIWSTSPAPNDILRCGDKLSVGQKLVSSNGAYYLIMQSDGNIGIFRTSDNTVVFSLLSEGKAVSSDYYAILQTDGNFAVKDGSDNPIWYNGTQNKNGVQNIVKLLNDGSLAVFSGNESIWSSKDIVKTNTLGEKIVQDALSFRGRPYDSPGNPPYSFDCSGLTQYVYSLEGISIPRTSEEQFKSGMFVDKSNLQPGDLVFFHMHSDGPGHVGIYIGNGNMIHAPQPGQVVKEIPMSWETGYCGARRFIK